MALSGSVLKTALKASILSQLQTLFPIPSGLQASEQALMQQYQDKLAQAIADGDGPTTVTHITTNAVVNASGPDPQGGTQTVVGTVT